MGTYYDAFAVIGYKISSKNRHIETKVPNCEHPVKPPIAYCPACGKKVGFHTVYEEVEGWEEFWDTFLNQKLSKLGLTFEWDDDNDCIWVGYGTSCDNGEYKMKPLKSYDEIKAEIQAALEPYVSVGLITLDDKDFGLHVTMMGH